MKNILLYLILVLFCNTGSAQTYIEPFIGFAADIRQNQRLNMINTGVQFAFAKKSGYEFIVGAVQGFGIKINGSDSSFTANPSLPIYSNAEKTVHAEFSGIYTNHRFRFFRTGKNQYVNFNFIAGIRMQRVVVNYILSNPDYIVLNPETNYLRLGIYAGTGFEYIYLFKKGRIFFQSNIITPSIRRKREKINSFNQPVPFNFNLGYSFPLKKANK